MRTTLTGKFIRVDEAILREKANRRQDPRHSFYEAMLNNNRYEDYEAAVGTKAVLVPSNGKSPFTGHQEILYARRSGWIADSTG